MSRFEPAYRQLGHFEGFNESSGGAHTEPRGGYTRFGIAQKFWPAYDVKNMTALDAREFYRREFWERRRLGEFEGQQVATLMFLAFVNMSPRRPARALQRACRAAISAQCLKVERPEVDGLLGRQTLAAANACDEVVLAAALRSEIVREYVEIHHEDPTAADELPGWTRRGYLDGLPPENYADLCNGEAAIEGARMATRIEPEPGEPGSDEDVVAA